MSTALGELRRPPARTSQATVPAAATLTIVAAAVIAPSLPAMARAHAGTPLPLAGLLVGGAGVGLAVPDLNLRLAELAPPEHRGRVLLGQFLSPLIAQPLIEVSGVAGTFTWTGIASAAGAIAAAPRLVRPPHQEKGEIR